MIVSTAVGLLALLVGLVIGWPVLVLLSIIFTVVQLVMVVVRKLLSLGALALQLAW